MSKREVTMYDWGEWLRTWNREIPAHYDATEYSELHDLLTSPPPQV